MPGILERLIAWLRRRRDEGKPGPLIFEVVEVRRGQGVLLQRQDTGEIEFFRNARAARKLKRGDIVWRPRAHPRGIATYVKGVLWAFEEKP